MGIRYEWADDARIIMDIFIEPPWTWAEYNTMIATVMPLLRDLNHPCSIAVDCSRVTSIPRDGNFLAILLSTDKMLPDQHFATMIVAAPYIVSMFMNLAMKLRPRSKQLVLFIRTMSEAHDKIYARYKELHPELAAEAPSNTEHR